MKATVEDNGCMFFREFWGKDLIEAGTRSEADDQVSLRGAYGQGFDASTFVAAEMARKGLGS